MDTVKDVNLRSEGNVNTNRRPVVEDLTDFTFVNYLFR